MSERRTVDDAAGDTSAAGEKPVDATAVDAAEPDMRSPGGEGTTVGSELGAWSGTTTGLGGEGHSTAGGGTGPDLSRGTDVDGPERAAVTGDR